MSTREISCELVGGPWDGQTGLLTIHDEPQRELWFSLSDHDGSSQIIVPGSESIDDKLQAVYVRIEEKPRKVITYEEINGHTRAVSNLGVRYRYSKQSPCEALFEQADRDALLTSAAHEAVMNTRKLLLDAAAEKRDR